MPAPFITIHGTNIPFQELKPAVDVFRYFNAHGYNHYALMDFTEDYLNTYHNPLFWRYTISDGNHLGFFLLLIREGFLYLPYDEADKEHGEIFLAKECKTYDTNEDLTNIADDLELLIYDWKTNTEDLIQALTAVTEVMRAKESED